MSIESLLTNFLSYEEAIKKQIRKNKEAKWFVKIAVNSAASKNDIDELIGLITKLNTKESISITINNQTYNNEELTENILLAVKWFQLNFKGNEKYTGLFELQETLQELHNEYTQSHENTNNQSDTESNSTNDDEETDVFYDAQGEEPDVSNIENDTQSNQYTNNSPDTESHNTNDEESDVFYDAQGEGPGANTGEQTLIQKFYQKITELWNTIVNNFMKMFGTRQTTENTEEQQTKNEPTAHSTSEQSNSGIRGNSKFTAFSKTKPNLDPKESQPEPTKPKTVPK